MADINPLQPLTTETEHESAANIEAITETFVNDIAATDRPRDTETGRFVAREGSEAEPDAEPAEGEDEDAAPPEEETSDEEEQETEPDVPTIDPPRFWSAEERAVWSSLTPDAQKIILAKETERDATTSRLRNEAAEEKKAVSQERQRTLEGFQRLSQLAAAIDPVIAEGNQIDWLALSRSDPAKCQEKRIEYEQRLATLNLVNAEIQRIQNQQAQEFNEAHSKRMSEVFPDYADPVKGKALRDSYAPMLKEVGFTPEEIEMGWGIKHDPRYLKILDRAVSAESKLAKIASERAGLKDKKVTQQAPKVVKPQANGEAKGKPSQNAVLEKRAKQSGRDSDMADYFLASMPTGSRK